MSILTKLFIVLQLIFAMLLSVMVIFFVNGQTNYRNELQVAQADRLAASASLADALARAKASDQAKQGQIDQLVADAKNLTDKLDAAEREVDNQKRANDELDRKRSEMASNVTSLSDTIGSLNKQMKLRDDELTKLRPQVFDLTTKNAELTRAVFEAQEGEKLSNKTIRELQEIVSTLQKSGPAKASAGAPAGAAVASSSPVTPVVTSVPVNGTVRQVQDLNGRTLVSLALGARDGVQIGTRFTVYRGDQYVGDMVVQRVTPEEAVGAMTLTRQKVQPNDVAISGPNM